MIQSHEMFGIFLTIFSALIPMPFHQHLKSCNNFLDFFEIAVIVFYLSHLFTFPKPITFTIPISHDNMRHKQFKSPMNVDKFSCLFIYLLLFLVQMKVKTLDVRFWFFVLLVSVIWWLPRRMTTHLKIHKKHNLMAATTMCSIHVTRSSEIWSRTLQ